MLDFIRNEFILLAIGAILATALLLTSETKTYSAPDKWNGYFSAQNFSANRYNDRVKLNQVKNTIRSSISVLPKSHTASLKNLTVKNNFHRSRGLSNAKKIILHTANIEDKQELAAVFIHEMGHIVDLGTLTGGRSFHRSPFHDFSKPIYVNDPSVEFYNISWRNNSSKQKNTLRRDFVSGYAMSSPFEDFAESYLFYRLHGDTFRRFAQNSAPLRKKYYFMKTQVFSGIEFQKNNQNSKIMKNDHYDSTLLRFDLWELQS